MIISLLSTLFSFAQKHTISGIIKDEKTGETLIGATIILRGKDSAAVLSNGYGFYSITLPANDYFLITSFSGYEIDTLKISLSIAGLLMFWAFATNGVAIIAVIFIVFFIPIILMFPASLDRCIH